VDSPGNEHETPKATPGTLNHKTAHFDTSVAINAHVALLRENRNAYKI
jgi:hypothetical protein